MKFAPKSVVQFTIVQAIPYAVRQEVQQADAVLKIIPYVLVITVVLVDILRYVVRTAVLQTVFVATMNIAVKMNSHVVEERLAVQTKTLAARMVGEKIAVTKTLRLAVTNTDVLNRVNPNLMPLDVILQLYPSIPL